MAAPIPKNEAQRLRALRGYDILDTLPEPAYDDIASVASLVAGAPIALMSLVDGDRQWFKARLGLEATETPRDLAFCAHAILEPDKVMVVRDATLDTRFSTNPLVTSDPAIRFYAGAPLVTGNGEALGTLCVIDRVPRDLTAEQEEALEALSRQLMAQLELRKVIREMERLAAEQLRYEDRLEAYQRQLETINEQLSRQSLTDGLTGLVNRRALEQRLDDELSRARRHGTPLSFLLLDVDHFKRYNDEFGHVAGDEALQVVSRTLQSVGRASDMFARFGGEEFAAVLPATDIEGALVMGERCRRALANRDWSRRSVTVSVGVAALTGEIDSAAALIEAADRALYEAKDAGRDRVVSRAA